MLQNRGRETELTKSHVYAKFTRRCLQARSYEQETSSDDSYNTPARVKYEKDPELEEKSIELIALMEEI